MFSRSYSIGNTLTKLIHLQDVAKALKTTGTQMFGKYLLLTNVGISMSLSATGDTLQQHYEMIRHNKPSFDAIRTRNMAISGTTVGFVCHYWYNWLDAVLPGRTIGIVLKKVVVDQIIFSPIIISLFFVTVGLLEKSSAKIICDEILEKGKTLYVAEWYIWPPAQVFNFYWLPTRYRVLYDNTISLGFDVFTSYVKFGDQRDNTDSDKETHHIRLRP